MREVMFPSLGAVLCLLSCRSKKVRPPAGTTDILENVTTYGYHADTNVLEWVKYPEDTDATKTSYTYDDMYRLATAAATTDTELAMSARYTYNDKDHLASITTPTTTYNFTYGNFGLRTSVSVGTQPLATYEYTNDENNYLEVLAYGNGDSVLYNYDDLGRLTTQTYQDDSDKVTYAYDNNGDLAQVYDSGSGITTKYYYDLIGRAMKYTETKSGYSHSVEYAYDTQNNLSSQTEIINGTEHNTTYTYDKDNRVTSKVTDNIGVYYTYDSFGRLTQQVTKNNGTVVLTETYTYKAGSAQIASHSTVGTNYSVTYSYTYDANGNILTVSDGTNTTSYVYDSANQVVRENNQAGNYTYTWTYDNAGNIQSKKVYDYTTGNLPETPTDTVAYGYNDEQWGDLLTSYDGSNITYDTIGNPDGYGNKSFTWEHGRELATLTQGANTWTYTYDANGMRTGRVCSNTYYYEYIYDGSQLIQMNSSSGTLYFTYDASGKPLTLTQGTTTYTYVTNLQGDVIGILNSNGKQVVTYTYDAWGNCTSSASDPIIMYNPLLYRGYVYDKETGLYYLQSRYYDPEIGRFINADGLVATGQGVTGNNLFAYCGNNPICFVDLNGMWRQVVGGWQAEIGDTLWGLAVQLYGNGSKWTTFGFGRDPKTLIVGEIIHTSNSINTTGSHGGKISLGIRDVTHEVNNALKGYISVAEDFAQLANAIPLYEIYRYGVFAGLVNHGATWDIKRKGPWESTIGTPFPGVGTPILYCGIKMTPENLGNLTYGLLGAAFGIPCQTLIDGSVFAAISSGAFRNMKGINNEFDDWLFIQLGYLSYRP